MRTTDSLADDHRQIRFMLACLDALVEDSSEHGRLAPEPACQLLSLFEYFADGLHQRKEELVVFPRVLTRIGATERVFVGKLFGEHERERHTMDRMRATLLGAVFGDAQHLRDFVYQARAYVQLHDAHMTQEGAVLFPLLERCLDEEDDRCIVTCFRKLEVERQVDTAIVADRVRTICRALEVQRGPTLPG